MAQASEWSGLILRVTGPGLRCHSDRAVWPGKQVHFASVSVCTSIGVTLKAVCGQASEWTDQEVLALLEGVQLHGSSWAHISQHVGSKSQVCPGIRGFALCVQAAWEMRCTWCLSALPCKISGCLLLPSFSGLPLCSSSCGSQISCEWLSL